jgi:hypothetical protein
VRVEHERRRLLGGDGALQDRQAAGVDARGRMVNDGRGRRPLDGDCQAQVDA